MAETEEDGLKQKFDELDKKLEEGTPAPVAEASAAADSADKYEYKKPAKKAPVIVDVPLPSGNIIQMQKPSKYSVLFGVGSLPSGLTGKAMEEWEEKGIGNTKTQIQEGIENSKTEEKLKLFSSAMKIRDKVLELSVRPKLTLEDTGQPGTVWVQEFDDDDLEFLFRWVAAGGIVSRELESFRQRAHEHAMGGPHLGDVGPEAERATGT